MPKDALEPKFAPLKHAARSSGLTEYQVRALFSAGEIVLIKVGRATLVELAPLDACLERKKVTKLPSSGEMKRLRKIRTDKMRRANPAPQVQ